MNKIDSKKVKFPLSSISLAWKFIWQNDENEEISMIFFMKKKKKKVLRNISIFSIFPPSQHHKNFFYSRARWPSRRIRQHFRTKYIENWWCCHGKWISTLARTKTSPSCEAKNPQYSLDYFHESVFTFFLCIKYLLLFLFIESRLVIDIYIKKA